MGMDLSTTGGVEWEPGSYEGYLMKLEKRFKKFTTKNEETGAEETEDRSFIIWHFGINEEGYEKVTLTAVSSAPPFGPKSKPRRWASAILRRTLGDDEKFNEDDLKGKPVMLNIFMKESDRGTFAEIESLSPVRKGKASPTSKKEEAPKEEELSKADEELMDKTFKAVDSDEQKAS
jgi:hypothetical protein